MSVCQAGCRNGGFIVIAVCSFRKAAEIAASCVGAVVVLAPGGIGMGVMGKGFAFECCIADGAVFGHLTLMLGRSFKINLPHAVVMAGFCNFLCA